LGQLSVEILPAKTHDLFRAQAGEARERHQSTIADNVRAAAGAGRVHDAAEIGGVERRPPAPTSARRTGNHRPRRVPARRAVSWQERVEHGEIHRRLSPE
jgi:hypothetical protein